MRTEQDKINRKEANQRYYQLKENKQQKRDYMKEYVKRDYVIAKRKNIHEEWVKKNGYRETSNEELHAKNSERFVNDHKR